jgi:hypothetical protein
MFTTVRQAAMLAGQIINCACVFDTVGVGVHVVQAIV